MWVGKKKKRKPTILSKQQGKRERGGARDCSNVCSSSTFRAQLRSPESCETSDTTFIIIVHFITSSNKVREIVGRYASPYRWEKVWGTPWGIPYGNDRVHSLNVIVHYSVNAKRSVPAVRRKVHNAPLDDTLTVLADDFLEPEAVPELEPELDPLLDEFAATVTCPEISEKQEQRTGMR